MAIPLLVTGTATGSWLSWPGGEGVWTVYASTWGGATAKLQMQDAAGNALDVDATNLSATADKAYGFNLPANTQIRLAIASGPPTAMSSYVTPNPAV